MLADVCSVCGQSVLLVSLELVRVLSSSALCVSVVFHSGVYRKEIDGG